MKSKIIPSGVLFALAMSFLFNAPNAHAQNSARSTPGKPVTASIALPQQSQPAHSHYWELGAGEYAVASGPEDTWGYTDLDKARFDWIFILFGNENPTGTQLNRLLKLNPDLKFLVRVWPIGSLGGSPANSGQATFLDYLYAPGVKEKLLAKTSEQIHQIMDTIDKPQNVMGFVFLEELPMHFTDAAINGTDPNLLSWDLKKYQKQIEAERGKPLVWDSDTRLWWGKKFTQVLNEINAHMKKESGKKAFVYLQGNNITRDYLPAGADFNAPNVFPFFYADVIKPGVADGFFAYPNTEQSWRASLNLASKNNWLLFSQLSHPSGMRVEDWEGTMARVKEKHPSNLGYFFFCGGLCRNEAWNDDRQIAANNNMYQHSAVSHHRTFAAQEKIGVDIVGRNLQPNIKLKYNSDVKAGEYFALHALVQNTRDASWYTREEDAILKNVRLQVVAPDEYSFAPAVTAPATIRLGDMKPGAFTSAIWYPKVNRAAAVGPQKPLKIVMTSDNAPPFTLTATDAKREVLPEAFHDMKTSGESWMYSTWHFGVDFPYPMTATMECIAGSAMNPTLQVGNTKVSWRGTLRKGQTLILTPDKKAVLKDAQSPQGRDATEQLRGDGLIIRGAFLNSIIYTDDDVATPFARIRVTVTPHENK